MIFYSVLSWGHISQKKNETLFLKIHVLLWKFTRSGSKSISTVWSVAYTLYLTVASHIGIGQDYFSVCSYHNISLYSSLHCLVKKDIIYHYILDSYIAMYFTSFTHENLIKRLKTKNILFNFQTHFLLLILLLFLLFPIAALPFLQMF